MMEIDQLKQRVAALEEENAVLRQQLLEGRSGCVHLSSRNTHSADSSGTFWESDHGLNAFEVQRYGRQLILPTFGPQGE